MALTVKTERDNFSRLGQGIVGTGSTMARDLLTSYISPVDLVAKVTQRGYKTPVVWQRLNKQQRDLVRNAGVNGYANFDISLIYILLRNVCTNLGHSTKPNLPPPTQGWGKDPAPNDMTPSDDMERLRILRNTVYGHVSKASISEPEYKIHWQELKNIAGRMKMYLGKDYLKELQDAEIYKITDIDVKQLIEEIKKGNDENLKQSEIVQEDIREMNEQTVKIIQEQNREIKQHTTDIAQEQRQEIKKQIADEGRKIIEHISGSVHGHRKGIEKLDRRLIEINDALTKNIPLAPLEEDGDTMPVDLLYASVVITEDAKSSQLSKTVPSQTGKEVSAPSDIFKVDGKEVKRIFLKGDAAHGKTTYCLWVVRKWCNAKYHIAEGGQRLDQWDEAMRGFDYVFLIQLRNVSPNRSDIIDMICYDLFGMDKGCHGVIRHVLSSDDYRTLIIMDGLDEWDANEDARKNLKCKDMPNIEGLSDGVVCLFSLRTWLFPRISRMKGDRCNILEIHGLSDSAIENVVENVLLNHYELQGSSVEFKETNSRIMKLLDDATLKSFMKIPLLAVVCVQICYEGENIGKSLTTFYSNMLNMLIERGHLQHERTKNMSCQTASTTFPKLLTTMKSIMDVSSIILKLGKVAYEGLIPNQRKLTFQERELRSEIGENELKFALNIGLISQNEARSLTARNVTVTFFHKSMQEFLAAIFFVAQSDVISSSFCEILSSIDVVMELSNFIMFACGLSPPLGCFLSQHVVSLTDKDDKICEYRTVLEVRDEEELRLITVWDETDYIDRDKNNEYSVRDLYKEQAIWFREIQIGYTTNKMTDKNVVFHVSDIYFDSYHEDRLQLTKYLVNESNFESIKSLHLGQYITLRNYGIQPTSFKRFFPKASSLVKLICIPYLPETCVHNMYLKSLKVLHLSEFTISSTYFRRNSPLLSDIPNLTLLRLSHLNYGVMKIENVPMLTNLPSLYTLEISNAKFGVITLENVSFLTNMPKLHTIRLEMVTIGDLRLKSNPLLANVPHLHSLEIDKVKIGLLELVNTPLLTNMPSIHTLEFDVHVGKCRLGNTPLLTNLPTLNTFTFENNLYSPRRNFLGIRFDIFSFLTHMPNLHDLSISKLSLCGIHFENTPQLRNVPNLRYLDLTQVTIGDIILKNSPLLLNMTTLIFFHVKFGCITLVNNAKAANIPKVAANNALDDNTGSQFFETALISEKSKVNLIFLTSVSFQNIILENIPLIGHLPNLEVLSLRYLTIRDISMKNTSLLTEMPKLNKLVLNDIEVLKINLKDASLISNLTNLRTFELNKFTVYNMCLVNSCLITNLPNVRKVYLSDVIYGAISSDGTPLITNLPLLQSIKINRLVLEIRHCFQGPALGCNFLFSFLDMMNLQKIVLENVLFFGKGIWKSFLESLTEIHNSVEIHLKNVEKFVTNYVCQSPDYAVRTVRIKYAGGYQQRFSGRYIGRHIYIGRYTDIRPKNVWRSCGLFIGKRSRKINGKFGRNVDRFVGKCVNIFVGRVIYDMSIEKVWPIDS